MITLPQSVVELEARLGLPAGSLADEDKIRAEAALEDATTLVLAEVSPARATLWASAAPRVVALVVLKAARREFDNPRGITQETLGEHSVGLSESSGVYLTVRELAQVRRAASGRLLGFVGSVRTPSGYGEHGDRRHS